MGISSPATASHSRDFNLHSLGWKAFQDLCATILSTVINSPVQVFAATHDRGRDAAFLGERDNSKHAVQCKFTSRQSATLTLADVGPEITKATRLAANGFADHYVLMTNYSVSGEADERISAAFNAIPGLKTFSLYSSQWINLQIGENKKLRALVPRLYGLGDLSEILDDRAYNQAKEILSSMGADLAKLVVTQAQQQAADALISKGFVLLLGDPASGKSTIAAGLSVAAIDMWGTRPVKPIEPAEFRDRWSPDERDQFFWFDDAFGTTQYQRDLTEQWNRIIPHLKAALSRGTKILLTSRTYIYERAVLDLKVESFPLLRDSQVVIRVQNLTLAEKSQILYNHIKLGSQPKDFKRQIKAHLPSVAANKSFLPETARRLGNPLFTQSLSFTRESVRRYIENPIPMLLEVIRTGDSHMRAALAVVFMSGSRLVSPIDLMPESREAVQRLGSDASNVITAIESLKDSLLKHVSSEDAMFWTFQHPTVRDAFATYVANNAELVDIYLHGTPVKQLIEEVVCGPMQVHGAKVAVPGTRYQFVVDRLHSLGEDQIASFLMTRCEYNFIKIFMQTYPEFLKPLSRHTYIAIFMPIGKLAIRLAELGLLPEDARQHFGACVAATVTETGDLEPLVDEKVRVVLNRDELAKLEQFAKTEFFQRFADFLADCENDWDEEDDPEEAFNTLSRSLEVVAEIGDSNEDIKRAIEGATSDIESAIEDLTERYRPPAEADYDDLGGHSVSEAVDESIFSDVAD
jgi:hypothetical protein